MRLNAFLFSLALAIFISPYCYAFSDDSSESDPNPRELELILINGGTIDSNDSHEEDVEQYRKGKRIPSRPIHCKLIERNGIIFQSPFAQDILSYEILDIYGNHITSSTDESDFIEFVFSLTGEYEVWLLTDEYIFKGYLNL